MQWLTPVTQTSGGLSTLWAPILGAIGMIVVGLITQAGTLRSASRTAQAQRDAALDDRADRQYAAAVEEIDRLRKRVSDVEARCDDARRDAADWRERYTRLRLAVVAAGLDPDQIISANERGSGGGSARGG